MKIKMKWLLIACSLFLILEVIHGAEITITGSWTEIVDVNDLQAGAGSDLIDTYESLTNQIELEVKGKKTKNWQIDVYRADTNWHPNFQLYVRRTGDGIGSGSINSGLSYVEILESPSQYFFDGGKNRKNVPLQLKLEGVSVEALYQTYTTTVYYTITDM